jgi:hypothetical protein
VVEMFRRLIVILSAAVACLLPASESVSATAAIAGDADTYDATIGRRADVPARALDLDSAFARGAREGVASTTTVDAAPFTYDVPTISRVGDHEFDDASASAARLRDVREGSASLSVEARGTSTTPSAQGVATEAAPQLVYRGGSRTADNMTPRPGIDDTGLSTFDTPGAAAPNGGKVQVIDTSKLKCTVACPDSPPPGHVSVRPPDVAEIPGWAGTRGTGQVSPYTQDILDAVVDEIRLPRP